MPLVSEVKLPSVSLGQPRGNGGLMALCKDVRDVVAEPSLESNKILALLKGRSIQYSVGVVVELEIKRRSRWAITETRALIERYIYIGYIWKKHTILLHVINKTDVLQELNLLLLVSIFKYFIQFIQLHCSSSYKIPALTGLKQAS